jgi:hypothetical protein
MRESYWHWIRWSLLKGRSWAIGQISKATSLLVCCFSGWKPVSPRRGAWEIHKGEEQQSQDMTYTYSHTDTQTYTHAEGGDRHHKQGESQREREREREKEREKAAWQIRGPIESGDNVTTLRLHSNSSDLVEPFCTALKRAVATELKSNLWNKSVNEIRIVSYRYWLPSPAVSHDEDSPNPRIDNVKK